MRNTDSISALPTQDCTICMERLTAPSGYKGPQPSIKPELVGKLSRCGHVYHIYCLVAMYNNGNKVRRPGRAPELCGAPSGHGATRLSLRCGSLEGSPGQQR